MRVCDAERIYWPRRFGSSIETRRREHVAEDAHRQARAFVVANMQPPKIIMVSSRERLGDQMVVFSHLEVWPWRIVLRGAFAYVEAPPLPEPALPVVDETGEPAVSEIQDTTNG